VYLEEEERQRMKSKSLAEHGYTVYGGLQWRVTMFLAATAETEERQRQKRDKDKRETKKKKETKTEE
jgi:hypothetical protein